MQEPMRQLREILAEVSDLNRAAAVLGWDQETYMPPGGVRARAEQLATLRRIAHVRFTVRRGRAGCWTRWPRPRAGDDPASDDASLIRVTKRDYDKACKLPPDAGRRDFAGRRAGAAGLDRGAQEVRFPHLRALLANQHRPEPARGRRPGL